MILLPALVFAFACVGQKEDPEEEPGPVDPGTVVDPGTGSEEGTCPFHRILALEFTASWCQYCPNMAAALSEAMTARPGRIVDMAVHQYDEVSPAEADAIVTLFKASGFPQMVFDWDVNTKFGTLPMEQSVQRMVSYVDATVEDSTCNLSLENTFADGKLQAKVTIKADEAASYSVAAALVQDRMVVDQVGYGPGYSCMSVLRQFLGAGMDGESLGSLEKDVEKAFTFTAEIGSGEAPEADFRVVAFVRRNGRVVNAVTGPLNGKIDYQYENEEVTD